MKFMQEVAKLKTSQNRDVPIYGNPIPELNKLKLFKVVF